MTTNALKVMTVSELVERFAVIAIDQDKAIFEENNTRYRKLYGLMEAVRRLWSGTSIGLRAFIGSISLLDDGD